MAKKRRVDPIKQREKRAKIAAIAGLVLFLAVAAFEVPSMMKTLNKKPPPGAYASDAGNRNPDGTIHLANVATGTGLTGSGQLADTDVAPASGSDQLVSFSVFETKNPFRPQVTSASAGTAAAAGTADTTGATSAGRPGADVPPATSGPGTGTTPAAPATTPGTMVPVAPAATASAAATPATTTPATTTPTVAPKPTVSISVNGVVSQVASQGTFPSRSPVFRLVSFDGKTAEVGIVGGSYATGDATLTLHLNRPITLENTNDGKRYTLELVATR